MNDGSVIIRFDTGQEIEIPYTDTVIKPVDFQISVDLNKILAREEVQWLEIRKDGSMPLVTDIEFSDLTATLDEADNYMYVGVDSDVNSIRPVVVVKAPDFNYIHPNLCVHLPKGVVDVQLQNIGLRYLSIPEGVEELSFLGATIREPLTLPSTLTDLSFDTRSIRIANFKDYIENLRGKASQTVIRVTDNDEIKFEHNANVRITYENNHLFEENLDEINFKVDDNKGGSSKEDIKKKVREVLPCKLSDMHSFVNTININKSENDLNMVDVDAFAELMEEDGLDIRRDVGAVQLLCDFNNKNKRPSASKCELPDFVTHCVCTQVDIDEFIANIGLCEMIMMNNNINYITFNDELRNLSFFDNGIEEITPPSELKQLWVDYRVRITNFDELQENGTHISIGTPVSTT